MKSWTRIDTKYIKYLSEIRIEKENVDDCEIHACRKYWKHTEILKNIAKTVRGVIIYFIN